MTGTGTFSCFGGILSTNDDAGLVGLVGAGDGFSTFLEAYGLYAYSNGINVIFGFGLISFIEMTEGLI